VWYRPWFFSKAHLDQVVDMSVRGKAMLEARRRRQDRLRAAMAAVMAARGHKGGGNAEVRVFLLPLPSHVSVRCVRVVVLGVLRRTVLSFGPKSTALP